MAPLDLDKYAEIAKQCKYLPENDLKVRIVDGDVCVGFTNTCRQPIRCCVIITRLDAVELLYPISAVSHICTNNQPTNCVYMGMMGCIGYL